ncbi:hypothetical protein QQS21_012499 [Conoideocrella luteorostrata]|uniref:Uncharacterized protein n=1 Tax=Conoideocrella luteorostrata TaxID=1105319 RepID=A0AAJ0CDX1_9HYPO|nr:hypothetical protein QQS21_012499 [Conoideocrella luteorostrata]
MANLEKRKRQRPEDFSLDHRPTKKSQTDRHQSRPNFPPEFWDNLSKVWLTPRALRELDRRNSEQPSSKPSSVGVSCKDIGRFARHGGPDLRHLRRYPDPTLALPSMASKSSGSSRRTQSTHATSVSSKNRRSSAYDADFEQDLNDHGIFANNRRSKSSNMQEIRQELTKPRPSLSPSQFSDGAFEDFQQRNEDIISEDRVMSDILPIIHGSARIPNERNLLFTNLDSITERATVDLKPDFYDGAPLGDVNNTVRSQLQKHIVPTKHTKAPVAPNYFIEAKAPRGGADVAKRQITHDLAIGARGMHSLQNYGEEDPVYDGNAYAYGSTYHSGAGLLQLYATHMTSPTAPGVQPEYHMTKIRGFDMTDSRETFVEGATAQRNLRDLAKTHRRNFIETANARALAETETLLLEKESVEVIEPSASQPLHYVEEYSQEDLEPAVYGSSQYLDEVPELPEYNYDLDEPEDDSQVLAAHSEPLASFATSFSTSVASSSAPKKRHRLSKSPPSTSHKKQGSNKGRKSGRANSSTQVTELPASTCIDSSVTSADDYWTWSNKRQAWYHRNADGTRTWDAKGKRKL